MTFFSYSIFTVRNVRNKMSRTNRNKDDLEKIVALIYKTQNTLQRNKNTAIEIKRRNTQTIQGTSQHFQNKENSINLSRLTESLNYTPGALTGRGKTSRRPSFHPSNPKPIYNDSASEKCLVQNSLPNMSTPHLEQAYPSKRKLESPEKNQKATPVSNSNLRTIIFRTLDRVLHVNSNKSQTSPSKIYLGTTKTKVTAKDGEMGLDTLQLLNNNVNDSFSSSLTRSLKYESISTARQISISDSECSEQFSNTIPSVNWKETTVDGSDNESWTFVPAPLHVNEVSMEDSLQYSEANYPISKEAFPLQKPCDDGNLMSLEDLNSVKKPMFMRKPSKGSANKVRKLQERQLEKKISSEQQEYYVTNLPQENPRRPDSPIQGQRVHSKLQPNNLEVEHLANLSEESFETISLDSTCGTNSFMRKIASQPSSTLLKETQNPSSSSTFSSFQMPDTCTQNQDNKFRMLPSTLCPEMQIMPINVPVTPWGDNGNHSAVNGELNVRELSEKFIPLKEEEDHYDHFQENINPKTTTSLETNGNQIKTMILDDGTASENTDTGALCITDKSCSSVRSTGSNAPAPPPLPNQDMVTPTYMNLQVFPVKVFTSVNNHKSVFNQMEDINIEPGTVQKLRDKFPLKKATTVIDGSISLTKPNEQESSKIPNKLNIEIYLKKWEINIETMVQCIKTLDCSQTNSEAITTLSQVIPKNYEDLSVEAQKSQNKNCDDQVEKFVYALMSINRLNEKVQSMAFCVNFKDDFTTLSKTITSFINACDSISKSQKFQVVINVILAFLKQWKSDGLSTICGFDIQGLNNLATKVSDDGTTNVIRFMIEYMYQEQSHTNSLDFYKDFMDFSEIGKTSISDMTEKYNELAQNLEIYENEYDQIKNSEEEINNVFSLVFAKSFLKNAKLSINSLQAKLLEAKINFCNCKERYCLTNADISEVDFFASLSNFVSICQKTHYEIIQNLTHKNNKEAKENSRKCPVKKSVATPKLQPNLKARRRSEPPTQCKSLFNGNPNDDLNSLLNQAPNGNVGPQLRHRRPRKSEILYV